MQLFLLAVFPLIPVSVSLGCVIISMLLAYNEEHFIFISCGVQVFLVGQIRENQTVRRDP